MITKSRENEETTMTTPGAKIEANEVKLVPIRRRKVRDKTQNDHNENVSHIKEIEAADIDENPLTVVSSPRPLPNFPDDFSVDDDSNLGYDFGAEHEVQDLSYQFPSCYPLIIVNLELLCGFVPKSEEEREAINDQVHQALANDDFEERVQELFEMKMARHGDSTMIDTVNEHTELSVRYPEVLCPPDGRVLTVSELWQKLHCKHEIAVVHRALTHLKNCDRALSWKSDMFDEIRALARREDEVRKESELEKWRSQDRKVHLDKLYQVRETFSHRLEIARIKMEGLEDAREQQVQQLGRGLQALDLNSNIFATAELISHSSFLRNEDSLSADESEEDIQYPGTPSRSQSEDSNIKGSQGDDESQQEVHEVDQALTGTEPGASFPAENTSASRLQQRANRHKRSKKRHRQLLENAAQHALEEKQVAEATEEEEQVREQFTTEELRMCQAAVRALEARLVQVDDLLETLQEDEWVDEEEGYSPTNGGDDIDHEELALDLTLLDQILAMILGTLHPRDGRSPDEQYYEWISREHKEITSAWKKHFGRLPKSTSESNPKASGGEFLEVDERTLPQNLDSFARRAALGIEENYGNWDDDKVGDWRIQASPAEKGEAVTNSSQDEQPTKTGASVLIARPQGLRPGGSLR
jgi:hypothetical protein